MKFDLITANPPLVPFPPEMSYPFIGHGGADGLVVSEKILYGLPEYLDRKSFAQIFALSYARDGVLSTYGKLQKIAEQYKLDIRITAMKCFDVFHDHSMILGLCKSAASVAGSNRDEYQILSELKSWISENGYNQLISYFISAQIGKGRVSIQNLSRAKGIDLWYVS